MITFSKTTSKPNYLFGLLSHYFKANDTYVPNVVTGHTTEGLLERYLEVFCEEIDGEVAPYIDNISYLYDATKLSSLPHSDPSRFLDYLALLYNNPPNIGTETQYKNLLRYMRLILQTKGTKQGLLYFLAIYGYTVETLTETSATITYYDSLPTSLDYDSGAHYDSGFSFFSGWDLVITDLPGATPNTPSGPWLILLKEAIQKFISPIFATLNSISYTP